MTLLASSPPEVGAIGGRKFLSGPSNLGYQNNIVLLMTDLSSIRVGGGGVSAHPETSKQSSTAHPCWRGSFSLESLLAEQMTRANLEKSSTGFSQFTLVSVFFVVNSTLQANLPCIQYCSLI